MIFKRNRLKVNDINKSKISAMILKYAGNYIRMGEDLEDRQNQLNTACSAWNIALLKGKEREKAIKTYLDKYQELNPDHNNEDVNYLEKEIRLLIKEKEKQFPEVKKQIVNSELKEKKGKMHITVMSLDVN